MTSVQEPETVGHQEDRQPEAHPHVITIHVNTKPVVMTGSRHTGLEIKQAAIAQKVKIDVSFLLYLIRQHQPNKLIEDGETVTITDHSEFHAVADDDNS